MYENKADAYLKNMDEEAKVSANDEYDDESSIDFDQLSCDATANRLDFAKRIDEWDQFIQETAGTLIKATAVLLYKFYQRISESASND